MAYVASTFVNYIFTNHISRGALRPSMAQAFFCIYASRLGHLTNKFDVLSFLRIHILTQMHTQPNI